MNLIFRSIKIEKEEIVCALTCLEQNFPVLDRRLDKKVHRVNQTVSHAPWWGEIIFKKFSSQISF